MEILNNNTPPPTLKYKNKMYLYVALAAFVVSIIPNFQEPGVMLYRVLATVSVGTHLIKKGEYEKKRNLVILGYALGALGLIAFPFFR